MNPPQKPSGQHSLKPLLILLCLYTSFFFLLACRKYEVMNSNARDTAWFTNMLWNSIHGKLLFSPYNGMSFLGNHAALIFIFFIPVYWLVPSVPTMLFLQSVLIAASAIPFYLIAQRILMESRAALLVTVAYLFYPTVVTNHVCQIHMEHLALPFLLGALYFLLERRVGWFFVCSGFALLVEEHISLTVFFFGVYALVRRMGIKWAIIPMLLGLFYGVFAFKVLIPHFTGPMGYLPSHYFKSLADTPEGLIKILLTQPWRLLGQVLTFDRVLYLFQIVQPVFWITPLLAPELLLVIPSLGINLITDDSSFRVIGWHYGPTVGAMLCVAAVFGVKRLAAVLERRWRIVQAEFALALSICALCVASWPLWLNVGEYLPHRYTTTLKKAVELVPPERSVLSPISMVAHFANRAYPMHLIQFEPGEKVQDTWPQERMYRLDYVILDGNEYRFPPERVTRELVMSFYTNTNYELIMNENNVFVFRHR